MSLLLALFLSGCKSDNFFTPFGNGSHDGDGPSPDITVWPDDIDFGSARVVDYESVARTISIANNGQADLELYGTRIVESEGMGFEAGSPTSFLIPPGARAELPAWFRPQQYTLADGAIVIDSNDPDEPEVAVAVHGVGIAPAISIDPAELDLGVTASGCVTEAEIDIRNVGNDTLVVDHLSFAATTPEIVIDDTDGATLEPGERKVVTLTYSPESDLEVHGVLTAFSNDPARPTEMATQVGLPAGEVPEEDAFEQPEQPMTDILFVIDNSNSMTPFQLELAQNGEEFLTALSDRNADWQVGVVTVDNPSLRGPVITSDMLNMENEFAYQVQAGTDAATDEYQLYRAWQALSSWGAFDYYLRDDAALAVILVSDERAQDPGVPRDTFMTEADVDYYADFLYGLKEDDSLVAIHVVGSPPPLGCYPAKEPGVGLDYAVAATGGIFLTICDADWGPGLASIAAASVPDLRVFHLSEEPVVESIEVTVDDVDIDGGTLWFYDVAENAVVFHEAPEAGSIIVIDYLVQGDCDQ
jgi:hypothetical protein